MFGRRRRHETPADTAVHPAGGDPSYPAPTARERYGGFSFASAFYGWLVAVALTVLLTGIAGAIAAGLGASLEVTPSELQDEAQTIGLASALVLLVILLVAYFAGGYVAGRMARFDGGRQGLGVWLIALIVGLLVATLGAVFGAQYDIFARVDLPSPAVTANTVTAGGIVALLVLALGTLLAAMAGGKAGQRYHTKVDRAAA